jgi:hypothetical protein
MKKFIISIIVVVVIIVGGFVIARNILARMIIIKGVKAVTGMTVATKRLSCF